ncbi:MAG: hypothetical protein JWQ98_1758 [Chlorobi bacterium]|nr:hypothetical protein [Chlorobiota bacterium]
MRAFLILCGIILFGLFIGYVTRPVSYRNAGTPRGDSSHIKLAHLPMNMDPNEFVRLFLMQIVTLDSPNDDWRDMWADRGWGSEREWREHMELFFYTAKIEMIQSGVSERDIADAKIYQLNGEGDSVQEIKVDVQTPYRFTLAPDNQRIEMGMDMSGNCLLNTDLNGDGDTDSTDAALAGLVAKHDKAKDILSVKFPSRYLYYSEFFDEFE